MGRYVDYYCKNENSQLKKIVDKIIARRFPWIPYKDYDDYYSLAMMVVWDCEMKFTKDKGATFETFLIGCLERKIKSRVTYSNRQKRSNGLSDLSIEKLIDDESSLTFEDMIAAPEEEALSTDVEEYLDSLTRRQRRIATLTMKGYTPKDIQEILHINKKKYKEQWETMTSLTQLMGLCQGRM